MALVSGEATAGQAVAGWEDHLDLLGLGRWECYLHACKVRTHCFAYAPISALRVLTGPFFVSTHVVGSRRLPQIAADGALQ